MRVGLIGAGRIGNIHAGTLAAHPVMAGGKELERLNEEFPGAGSGGPAEPTGGARG